MRSPVDGELDRLLELLGQLQRAGEVVGGADRDDPERDAGPCGGLGRATDRAVAAGDDDPLRARSGDLVDLVELEAGDLVAEAFEQPLDLPRLARPGVRVGEQCDHGATWASCPGPRGPSGRSCWPPCARSRTASRPGRPPCREACRPRPGRRRRSCRRPSAATTRRAGSRNARMARMMQTPTTIAMVMSGFPSLATGVQHPYPQRRLPKTGQNPRPWASAEQVAAYERQFRHAGLPLFVEGFSASTDVFNRAAPLLGLVFIGEILGAGNLDWSWWQNLLAVLGGLAFVLGAVGGDQRRPGPPGARDPASARQDRAGRVRDPAGAAAADLRRPARQRRDHGRRQPADPGADLRDLRLRAAGDPALGVRAARGPAALVARAAGQGGAAARDLRPALVHDRGDVGDLRDDGDVRLRRGDRALRRPRDRLLDRPRSARDQAPRARGGRGGRRSPAPSASTSAWCCSSARRSRC